MEHKSEVKTWPFYFSSGMIWQCKQIYRPGLWPLMGFSYPLPCLMGTGQSLPHHLPLTLRHHWPAFCCFSGISSRLPEIMSIGSHSFSPGGPNGIIRSQSFAGFSGLQERRSRQVLCSLGGISESGTEGGWRWERGERAAFSLIAEECLLG